MLITLIFHELFSEELKQCELGNKIRFWSAHDNDLIYAYRQGTSFGHGKVATLLKSNNLELARIIDERHPVWMIVDSIAAGKYSFSVQADLDVVKPLPAWRTEEKSEAKDINQ